jgi:hypothetical protein
MVQTRLLTASNDRVEHAPTPDIYTRPGITKHVIFRQLRKPCRLDRSL